jgi:ribosome-binding protein aMBF1 (putative translation factor)
MDRTSVSDDRDAASARAVLARPATGTEQTLTEVEIDALLAAPTPLALWRAKRGMSQSGLARKLGISQGFLSEIESGKKSGDVGTLRKLARALEVTLDDLAGD